MSRGIAILWGVVLFAGLGILGFARMENLDEWGELPKIVALVVVLVMIGLGLWSEGAFGRAVRHALGWMMVAGVLIFGYQHRDRLEWEARRVLGDFAPPIATVEPASTSGERVVVERQRGSQFRVRLILNEAPVTMLVDTGASIVTLTHDDALAAGIEMAKLRYDLTIYTANGRTTAAPVVIDRIAIGNIERRRIAGLVARPGVLERSLLGLSFLDTLASYTVTGDRLEFTP